jgi:hypothetical protein
VLVRYTTVVPLPMTVALDIDSAPTGRLLMARETVDLIERGIWIHTAKVATTAESAEDELDKLFAGMPKKREKGPPVDATGWTHYGLLATQAIASSKKRTRKSKVKKEKKEKKKEKKLVSQRLIELRCMIKKSWLRRQPVADNAAAASSQPAPSRPPPRIRRHVVIQKRYHNGILISTKRTSAKSQIVQWCKHKF